MEINLSTFIYAGLFINNKEKEKLIKAIPNLNILLPSAHTIYCDHLTLLFKNDIYTNKGQEILDFIKQLFLIMLKQLKILFLAILKQQL